MANNTTAPSNSTDPIDPILRELDLKAEADQKRRVADLRREAGEAILSMPNMPYSLEGVEVTLRRMFSRWSYLERGEKIPPHVNDCEFYAPSDESPLCSDEREEIASKIAALLLKAGLPSHEEREAVEDAISDVADMFPGY